MSIAAQRHPQIGRIGTVLGRFGIFAVVAVLIVAGRLSSSEFLSANSLLGIVQDVSLLGIVAAGVMFVTFSGHYADLSVPTVMSLSGIVTVSCLKFGLVPAMLIGIVSGVAVGLINGWVVGYLRANPIIWTLVTLSVGNGLIRWALGNKQTYPDTHLEAGRLFESLFGARVLGSIPIVVVILLGMVVTGQLILIKTKFGEQLRLVGASYEVAKLTGINVRLRSLQAFALSAAAASIGGILLASLNKLGADYIGKGYDFKTVTAIVLGGVSLAGGRGNMLGVLGGVLAIGLLENVLSLNGVSVDLQEVVKGVVFIAVVGTAAYIARRQGGDDD